MYLCMYIQIKLIHLCNLIIVLVMSVLLVWVEQVLVIVMDQGQCKQQML